MPEAWTYDRLGRVTAHTDALAPPPSPFGMYYLGQTSQLKQQISGVVGTNWFYDSNLNDRRLTGVANRSGGSHFRCVTTPDYDFASITEGRRRRPWSEFVEFAARQLSVRPGLWFVATWLSGATLRAFDPANHGTQRSFEKPSPNAATGFGFEQARQRSQPLARSRVSPAL